MGNVQLGTFPFGHLCNLKKIIKINKKKDNHKNKLYIKEGEGLKQKMYKSGSIGIFDSGIGGSTVLKEIIKILPQENYIYYSDSKNNPYGDKTDYKIKEICDNIVQKLINQNCKIIVIACNTASARAVRIFKRKIF